MSQNDSYAGENHEPFSRPQDPVIEAYKKDVDRTLLRANLRLSVAERFEHFDRFAEFAKEIYDAGERSRAQNKSANQR